MSRLAAEGQMWEREAREPALWFHRFDTFYRPLGPERNLLRAYKTWHQAEKRKRSDAVSAPTSWREAAEQWRWAERAVEKAPPFVAVALQRYCDAFGITPELVD